MKSKYLWFLTLSYVMVLAFANWFDPRLVKISFIITDAGTLIFPLTYLLSDLITEVYGYKHARRAIWVGFFFNLLFVAYGQLVIHLPNPSYHTNNAMFNTMLALDGRVIVASLISYLIAEPLNSYMMAKLKIKCAGKFLGLRFVSSTFFASAVDSVIFGIIAFLGVFPNNNLVILIITMWLIKVVIEVIGLPISIYLAKKLKKVEQLDRYDTKTRFNIFSLDTSYDKSNDGNL